MFTAPAHWPQILTPGLGESIEASTSVSDEHWACSAITCYLQKLNQQNYAEVHSNNPPSPPSHAADYFVRKFRIASLGPLHPMPFQIIPVLQNVPKDERLPEVEIFSICWRRIAYRLNAVCHASNSVKTIRNNSQQRYNCSDNKMLLT